MTVAVPILRPPQGLHLTRRAVRDILPLALAVVPFGTVIGVTLDLAGLTGLPALAGTVLLYAGSAELAALSVLTAGGGPLGAVLAGAVVNSRLLLYSAGLSTRFREQPGWFRWLAPLTTVDQTFALATEADDLDGREFRRYWLTIGIVLGVIWVVAVGAGMGLGSALPDHNPMEVAAPATMVALLMPHLGDRRMRRVALAAAIAAAAGAFLPGGVGIVVAIVVALAAGGSGAAVEADAPVGTTTTEVAP